MATDAELNNVAGLRRIATYRTADSGKKNRRHLRELREQLKGRTWGTDTEAKKSKLESKATLLTKPVENVREEKVEEVPKKQRKGKKQREKEAKRAKAAAELEE